MKMILAYYLVMGVFFARDKNDYAMGIEMYKRVLEEDPSDLDTLVNLGEVLYKQTRDHDEIEAIFKRVLAEDPKQLQTLINYGSLLMDIRKDYDEAEKVFKRTLKLDPNDVSTLL